MLFDYYKHGIFNLLVVFFLEFFFIFFYFFFWVFTHFILLAHGSFLFRFFVFVTIFFCFTEKSIAYAAGEIQLNRMIAIPSGMYLPINAAHLKKFLNVDHIKIRRETLYELNRLRSLDRNLRKKDFENIFPSFSSKLVQNGKISPKALFPELNGRLVVIFGNENWRFLADFTSDTQLERADFITMPLDGLPPTIYELKS